MALITAALLFMGKNRAAFARCKKQHRFREAAQIAEKANWRYDIYEMYKRGGYYDEAAAAAVKAEWFDKAKNLYESIGRYTEAFRCAVAQNDQISAAYYQHRYFNRHEEALQHAKRASNFQVAGYYERAGDWAAAGREYERQSTFGPISAFIPDHNELLKAARCFTRAGQHADAARCVATRRERISEHGELALLSSKINPETACEKFCMYRHGVIHYLKKRDYEAAAKYCRRLGHDLFAAWCYERGGNWSGAAACYRSLQRTEERLRCLLISGEQWLLAEFYRETQQWELAAQHYSQATLNEEHRAELIAMCQIQASKHRASHHKHRPA